MAIDIGFWSTTPRTLNLNLVMTQITSHQGGGVKEKVMIKFSFYMYYIFQEYEEPVYSYSTYPGRR